MVHAILSWIESIIVPWGGWGVFAGSILEEVIVPIPSAMVQMGAGFFLLSGTPVGSEFVSKLLLLVIIPSAFGVAIGSLPVYGGARYLGRPAIAKYGRFFAFRLEDVDAFTMKLSGRRALPLVILMRMLPILPSAAISAAAGVLRVPLSTYLLGSVAGTALRAAILGTLGALVGAAYQRFAEYVDRFEKIGLLVLCLAIAGWWVRRRLREDKSPPPIGDQ